MFEFIVLGMLLDNPKTGYAIKKDIEYGVGNFYKASYGSLYPTLKKLTDKNYLIMTEESQGSRLKKYYKITEKGKQEFMIWLAAPLDPNIDAKLQLVKVFFFGELPEEIRIQRLEEYEQFVQQGLGQLYNMAKNLPSDNIDDKDYFAISTLYIGLQSAKGMLEWLQHIKTRKPLSEFLK